MLVERSARFQVVLGNDKDFLATRVSYKLNLRGPELTVQTACSTSLVAVAPRLPEPAHRRVRHALAGGVVGRVPQRAGYLYQEGGIALARRALPGVRRRGPGTVAGNGVGVVVLKRLADALADGDTIYAVIRGSAINNDGSRKVGYTAPSVEGQAEVIARRPGAAPASTPETIGYVEAHGTGTRSATRSRWRR